MGLFGSIGCSITFALTAAGAIATSRKPSAMARLALNDALLAASLISTAVGVQWLYGNVAFFMWAHRGYSFVHEGPFLLISVSGSFFIYGAIFARSCGDKANGIQQLICVCSVPIAIFYAVMSLIVVFSLRDLGGPVGIIFVMSFFFVPAGWATIHGISLVNRLIRILVKRRQWQLN